MSSFYISGTKNVHYTHSTCMYMNVLIKSTPPIHFPPNTPIFNYDFSSTQSTPIILKFDFMFMNISLNICFYNMWISEEGVPPSCVKVSFIHLK